MILEIGTGVALALGLYNTSEISGMKEEIKDVKEAIAGVGLLAIDTNNRLVAFQKEVKEDIKMLASDNKSIMSGINELQTVIKAAAAASGIKV